MRSTEMLDKLWFKFSGYPEVKPFGRTWIVPEDIDTWETIKSIIRDAAVFAHQEHKMTALVNPRVEITRRGRNTEYTVKADAFYPKRKWIPMPVGLLYSALEQLYTDFLPKLDREFDRALITG